MQEPLLAPGRLVELPGLAEQVFGEFLKTGIGYDTESGYILLA
jgi:hypothetical protein